jgi:hypothetical protein
MLAKCAPLISYAAQPAGVVVNCEDFEHKAVYDGLARIVSDKPKLGCERYADDAASDRDARG